MIKAIIFDCFGVLTTDGWLAFKKRHFRDNKELAVKATELNRAANASTLSYQDFLVAIAQLAGITAGEVQKEIESNISDEEVFDYIKTLKPKYKIGLLSNVATNQLQKLFTNEQIAVFDGISLSYETGAVKPDPRAYKLAAEKLGVQTSECIFIDDQQKHVDGAQAVGMPAVLYQDFDQMKSELEKILAAGPNN
jgi:epoxide hydrolase-like predicted phosphatase